MILLTLMKQILYLKNILISAVGSPLVTAKCPLKLSAISPASAGWEEIKRKPARRMFVDRGKDREIAYQLQWLAKQTLSWEKLIYWQLK